MRAVGAALRAARLYSPGHTLTRQSLEAAQNALHAYLTDFGPLGVAVLPRGVRFDFHPQPYEDELTGELSRVLRAALIAELQFLRGMTRDDILQLIQVLHLPKAALERVGGAGRALRERGVMNVAATDVAAPPSATTTTDPFAPLAGALRSGPDQFLPRLVESAQGDAATAGRRLRELDRVIATWPKAEQAAAWDRIAAGLLRAPTSFHVQVVGYIVRSVAEPWAATIAARWPAVAVAGLLADDAQVRSEMPDVSGTLRALHRTWPQGAMPATDPPPSAAFVQAGEAITDVTPFQLRARAFSRLLWAVRGLEPKRAEECLAVVEREIIAVVDAGDVATVAAVVSGLAALAHRLRDARADLARASLRRVLASGVGDLLIRVLLEQKEGDDPLRAALRSAPREAVPMLLELLADDERLQVRREIVSMVASVARGHAALVGEHLMDPRWYVARNVVTTLGEMRDPQTVPYLRAALHHTDLRVRREALQTLAALQTPDARAVLQEALAHSDAATRVAAAHWISTTGTEPDR